MKNKELFSELVIAFIVIILLFLSFGINLFDNQEETINKNKKTSISYSPYTTWNAPMITLSGSERNDMAELAKRQEGVQEDGTPLDGYTPYHRWAAGATQFGSAYGTQWFNNSNYYEYWCVMFVNWCAYNAGLDCHNNYAIGCISNSDAQSWYASKGRVSYTKADSALEKGWLYISGPHMRICVANGGGDWVDGNSYDDAYPPAYDYVTHSSRARRDFDVYGKPYYRSTLYFNTNGGAGINPKKYTEETSNITFPTPTKSGYEFLGWYTNSGFTSNKFTKSQPGWRGNVTLYAKWQPADRAITYVLNNGWWDGNAGANKYRVGVGYTLPRNVKKGNGSTFVDWYTDSGCMNKITGISTTANTDITVYAGYIAPISFVTNNGTWGSTPISTYREKRETTLPTNVTRPGCMFDGWFYDEELTRRVNSNGRNNVLPRNVEGSITLYARWVSIITYHTRTGSWMTSKNIVGDDGGPTERVPYYPGINYKNPGLSNGMDLYGAAELYEPWSYFAGWYTSYNLLPGTGPLYKVGDMPPDKRWPWYKNVVLYARWIGYWYKIYLHGNRGDTNDNSWTKSANYEYYKDYQYKFRDNQYSLPAFSTMYKRGYTFQHWHDNDAFSGSPVTSTDKNTGGDKHYYAEWEPNKYPLILNSYRGKVTDGSYNFTDLGNYQYRYNKEYTYDTYVPLPTQPATIDRRGHSFDGWYRKEDYSDNSVSQLVPGDIDPQEFYAKWTPITYKLVMHTNGANVSNPRIDNGQVIGDDIVGTYTYGKGSTFPEAPTDISKPSAIFAGWYKTADNTGNSYKEIASGDTDTSDIGDQEYWGRWVRIEPNTAANDASEVVNGELVLYLYSMGKYIVDDHGVLVGKSITNVATKKRFFSLNISTDNASSTERIITIWLSTSSDPTDKNEILDWTFTTDSNTNINKGGEHTIVDQCNITYTCPSDIIESYVKEEGSRKIYMHLQTESGDVGTYNINLVKRVVYQLH